MNQQNVTVLCLRQKDLSNQLINTPESYRNNCTINGIGNKSHLVQYADCDKCGETVYAKTELKLSKVICLHCA